MADESRWLLEAVGRGVEVHEIDERIVTEAVDVLCRRGGDSSQSAAPGFTALAG